MKREKSQGRFVYYSSDQDVYDKQRQRRRALHATGRHPTPAEAVAILVEKIKHPTLSYQMLLRRLRKQNVFVEPGTIENLFLRQGLTEKNATYRLIRCLSESLELLLTGVSVSRAFPVPPLVEFRPLPTHCSCCGCELNVLKTRVRTLSTLHIGRFRAKELFLVCPHRLRMKYALGLFV